jgi:hypothetical protein
MPLGPTCAKATLNAGQNFIVNVNGMANYTGDIADVFSCIAQVGEGGCGFEHQFESVLRALGADGAAAPPQNANFLRADAFLAIVLITNEDDCSAPPDSDLFDSSSATIDSPLGPLQSYRCNEFGHLCGGHAPPRQPANPPVDLSGMCVSAEDGRLLRIHDIVTAMKRLKADPSKVLVAAITGPPTPYKVNVGPSQTKLDPSMWPYVEFSCVQQTPGGGTVDGAPAVRLKQLIDAFGANGTFETICADDFGPALQRIAQQVGQLFAPCLPADPSACKFVDNVLNAAGFSTPRALPPCKDATDAGPCWSATPSVACPSGQTAVFKRPLPNDPTVVSTTATCPM